MERSFFWIVCILFSMSSVADTQPESNFKTRPSVDKSVNEFSNTMGINNIISATMQQTRDSLKSSVIDLSSNLRNKYPNLTAEQNIKLNKILNNYIDYVISSINTDEASYVYASVIAEGMSKDEVDAAIKYYRSPEGQNLLKVVGIASAKLNKHMLDKMTESVKIAQRQLNNDLIEFNRRLTETPSQ